jgi:hypothetical protein
LLPNPFDSILRAIGPNRLQEIDRKRASAIGAAQFEDDACGVSRLRGKYTLSGGTPIPQVEGAMLCFGEGDIFLSRVQLLYYISKFF